MSTSPTRPPWDPAGTHVSRQLGRQGGHLLLRGLQLAAQLADLLREENKRGERGRALAPAAAARWGPGGSDGHGLTSDCIFSSAWQREGRERQTEAGSQEGSEARPGSARGGRHAQSPPAQLSAPVPTRAPPARSHARGGAARRRLLRRSRWRTRWRPGTAPIRELQQNKTRQEAERSWGHRGSAGTRGRRTQGRWLQGTARSSALGRQPPRPGRAAWGTPTALPEPGALPLCLGLLSLVPRTPGTAGHPPRLKPAHQHLGVRRSARGRCRRKGGCPPQH